MIHDIFPVKLNNHFSIETPCDFDICLYFKDSSVLLLKSGEDVFFPQYQDFKSILTEEYNFSSIEYQIALEKENKAIRFFLIDFTEESLQYILSKKIIQNETEASFDFFQAGKIFKSLKPRELSFASITCFHIANWKKTHSFCGRCGTKNTLSTTERAFICPKCNNIEYPKISPAIITAVIDRKPDFKDDRLLLVKNVGANRDYSLIAGFVEIGETFEQAVEREVKEEVGLKVKNIRYYKNQPWGFSGAQMIAFITELDGSDETTLQESEIQESRWVTREECPESLSKSSVGNEMRTLFKQGLI